MKEHPIILRAHEVRAVLTGTQTQMRRVVKPKPTGTVWQDEDSRQWLVSGHGETGDTGLHCPHGQPDDRLWARETWAAPHRFDHNPPRWIPPDARVHYAATEDLGGLMRRPSIFMPRWASRITLEIVSVRIERLQDISEVDAIAEGVTQQPGGWWSAAEGQSGTTARAAYALLWESINGPSSWSANPWVWAIEFRRIEK